LPVGIDACAGDFSCGVGEIRVDVVADFNEAGILAFEDLFADYMGTYIEDICKPAGGFFRVFEDSRLDEDVEGPAACGEDPAAAIENSASLGLEGRDGELLLCAKGGVLLVFEILKIKTPYGKGEEDNYQEGENKQGQAGIFHFSNQYFQRRWPG
jgi:hypothetical protein